MWGVGRAALRVWKYMSDHPMPGRPTEPSILPGFNTTSDRVGRPPSNLHLETGRNDEQEGVPGVSTSHMYLETRTETLAGPRVKALYVWTRSNDRWKRLAPPRAPRRAEPRHAGLCSGLEAVAVAVADEPTNRVPRLVRQDDRPAPVGGLRE